ncbi:UvrD-helicase domain-containing protein [Desulfonema magnum]|uniref:DNA 3'-5' helicase n=1 Tax=Desulfonema magnum TaxID=45655 RepID=A0A975BK85_9BACT|nr:UvrD-helicase domain-containing protein [Desulfonema magnum]QTA87046.1 DNA helicase [Desulfonema magnum]
MKFIADLHVHSKFSRATAKNLDLENLYISAQLKGITLVGTGDFTHPEWIGEIQEKLIPAETGLFKLRHDIAETCDAQVPQSCRGEVRFILQCEISNIYKKNDKTRKNHHLIFAPNIETALRFNSKLDAIGNIKSDGRPILGLDAKELFKILLDCSEDSFLIPAHIWTPWFSVLGSKSGFDSLEECFEELVSEIFAAETGLSSDAPMNWRVSGLDALTLVSNSDAHSPANLGRNANIFDTERSYSAIRSALKTGDPAQCLGTIDMYPEEGKYHFDGHRKCNVCLRPDETIAKKGICPVCGKPLTVGVLYRVEELADRPEGIRPPKAIPFYHIIPLAEILSEIFSVGPKTKKVGTHYQTAIETLGPELNILQTCPADDIDKVGIPLLGEAIKRMRAGDVHISPGYDGEYGKITVFDPREKEKLLGQQSLFVTGASKAVKKKKKAAKPKVKKKPVKDHLTHEQPAVCEKTPVFEKKPPDILGDLNEEQRQAVQHEGSPLLIIAGPGAGKTRTLTHRIAYLIKQRNVSAENILAVTFTNKAAQEMKDRLKSLLDDSQPLPLAATFHALCFQILKEQGNTEYSIIDEDERKAFVSEAIRQVKERGISVELKPDALSEMISSAKQHILEPQDDLSLVALPEHEINSAFLQTVYQTYQALLEQEIRYDYDDLILNVVKLLESDEKIREAYQNRFRYIFADEYQDLNQGQYRIIKALSPSDTELCVIGDPDQSIYGFRGSDVRYFQRFVNDYQDTKVIRLTRNYRSAETILEASHQIIKAHSINPSGTRVYSNIKGIQTLSVLEAATEKAEAVAVGKTIENMIGGMGFHSIDFGKTEETGIRTDRGFSDFAVLYRTNAQSQVISDIFKDAGIPHQIANREHAYNRKGIAELISFLKVTEDAGILRDFQKIVSLPGSGIGKKTFDIFKAWFYQNTFTLDQALANVKRFPLPEMDTNRQRKFCTFVDRISEFKKNMAEKSVEEKLMFLFENTGISSMIKENVKTGEAFDDLVRTAKAFGVRTSDFFEMIVLQTNDTDTYDFNAEKVTLMTMHAAKGLEFPVVFITGCEKDYLPFKRSEDEEIDIDEERRLFYVAMTRAKDRLFLTHVKKRTVYGKTVQREISPFVADIEQRLITLEKIQAKKRKKERQVQLDLFN